MKVANGTFFLCFFLFLAAIRKIKFAVIMMMRRIMLIYPLILIFFTGRNGCMFFFNLPRLPFAYK